MENTEEPLTIVLCPEELALLKKHNFPCSERVIASALETDEGLELSGSDVEFEMLVGFVASEANHTSRSRRPRQAELLDSIADQIECVLTFYRR